MSEQALRVLNKILGKFERTMGVRIWGEIEGAPGTYAKILVKSDGTVKVEGIVTVSGSVNVSDRAARLLGIIYGDQGQLAQRTTTRDSLVQLRHAGSEIDPRLIQDIQKVVTPTYLTPTALAAGETATIVSAPGSGYKLRLKGIQISVDKTTRIDLRWATSAWRSYYLPANGSIERNFISENIEGGNNQALTLLSSAAANVTASATTETLAV